MLTLLKEMKVGCESKHSSKFNFECLNLFIEMITSNSFPNMPDKLLDIVIRLRKLMKLKGKFKDNIIGWTAHAKLNKVVKERLDSLLKYVKEGHFTEA